MPFVKKSTFQSAQPDSSGISSVFVGRTDELFLFVHQILQPDTPTHNILSISGQGGVGKSTLLDSFMAEAQKAPFNDYCQTAIVDEHQTDPISIMEQFVQQLGITGTFAKAHKRYKEALRKQQAERETLGEMFSQSVPDLAGAVMEGIPLAGPLLREGTKIAASHLLQQDQASQARLQAELLETPVSDLTRAFLAELNRLATKRVRLGSARQRRQRRIVLFFDTFEQLASEVTPWLLDHFLKHDVNGNVVLVVAGRDPIERSSPKGWLRYETDIARITLNSFTEAETRRYLSMKSITEEDQIATIWHLSRGLPLYLALLTANPQGDIDPTQDVVTNFLCWIPEQESMKRQLAIDAALFSRPFNQDDLEAFSYLTAADRKPLYQWLTRQAFVRQRDQDGRYLYHDVARDLFGRHLHQLSQQDYFAIRRALANYYQAFLDRLQAERGKEVVHSDEWLEVLLALVSQLLFLPDRASCIKAIEHVVRAYHTSREQLTVIAKALRALAQRLSPLFLVLPLTRQPNFWFAISRPGIAAVKGWKFLICSWRKLHTSHLFLQQCLLTCISGEGEHIKFHRVNSSTMNSPSRTFSRRSGFLKRRIPLIEDLPITI